MTKVHSIGVRTDQLPLILWPNAQGRLSRALTIQGSVRTPNQLLARLFDYWGGSRRRTGGAPGSAATADLVDRAAEAHGLPVYETPVGFKFNGELINESTNIIGGEESAGLSIKGHYPEKDGVLACLLAAKAVATRGTSVTDQLNNSYSRVGEWTRIELAFAWLRNSLLSSHMRTAQGC